MEVKQASWVFCYSVTDHPKLSDLKQIYHFCKFFGLPAGSSAAFTWARSRSFLQREVSSAGSSQMASFMCSAVGAGGWLGPPQFSCL